MDIDTAGRRDDANDSQAVQASAKSAKSKKSEPLVRLDSSLLSDVDVSLTVVLGRGSLSVRELLDLRDGSVLNLDTPLDGDVDILLNGRLVATGEIVAVGDRFGVRIAKIVAGQE